MAQIVEILETPVERLLKFSLSSDPRCSRYPVPEAPAGVRTHPAGYVTVTPDMARDWVTNRLFLADRTPRDMRHPDQRHNRVVSPAHVLKLKRMFENDEWDANVPDSEICFTEDGYILDGQHRLCAALLAGVTFKVLAKVAVPWNTFAKMGTGLRRAPQQFLHNYPYQTVVGSAVRHILPVLHGSEERDTACTPRDGEEMLAVADAFPWLRGSWVTEVNKVGVSLHAPRGPLLASIVMAMAAGGDEYAQATQNFLTGLETGANLTRDDPRYVLREKFRALQNKRIREGHLKRSLPAAEQGRQVAFVRQAFAAWMDERSLAQLVLPRKLPAVWRADDVRTFYARQVGL
jgi:hypothetical protein